MAAVLQLHALHQVARSASIRTRRLVRKKRSLQLLGGGAAAHLIHNGPTSGQHEQEGAEETRVSNERFHHSVVNDRNWAAGGALPAGAASGRLPGLGCCCCCCLLGCRQLLRIVQLPYAA